MVVILWYNRIMKLCVFQGTFNPIHNAHTRVAEFVAAKYDFDKILFIPAFNPPHKSLNLDMSYHRLEMAKLAVKNNSKFEVSDIEFRRKGKSYTYLTIIELYKEFPVEGKINFLIGTDAFQYIEKWYETDKLKNLVKFIVFVREDNFDISKYDYLKDKGYEFEFQPLSYEDISSTELRKDLKLGKSISNYVAKEVEDYIKKNGLYKN